MKKMVLGLILFISSNVQAQTYSSVTKDKEISDFLNGFIVYSYHGHKLSVNNQIMGPLDTADLHESVIQEFFAKTDISFLEQQIKAVKKDTWGHPFGHNKLVMKISVKSNPPSTIFSYSIPLFSADRKKAIVIEGFYCGMLCGGTAYYICELQTNGTWKKVKKFEEWAE